MRSQASGERQSGSVKVPARARRKVSYGSLETALNGGSPVSISKTRTPRPHQSDAHPVPLRWITSGACTWTNQIACRDTSAWLHWRSDQTNTVHILLF